MLFCVLYSEVRLQNVRKTRPVDIEQLVVDCQSGSRGAFDELVLQFQKRALKLATMIVGRVDLAHDVTQQAFVTAYLKIKKLKDPCKFESWLLRIVANTAISELRSAKRRNENIKNLSLHATDPYAAADSSYRTDELRSAIAEAMTKLTKSQARAIALFCLEDLPHKQVSEVMGCSENAARWHLHKARKKLKVLLKDFL